MTTPAAVIEEVQPLRTWMLNEGSNLAKLLQQQQQSLHQVKHESILRKLTVAYFVARLLNHYHDDDAATLVDEGIYQLDNFVIITKQNNYCKGGGESTAALLFGTSIIGVNMISPPMRCSFNIDKNSIGREQQNECSFLAAVEIEDLRDSNKKFVARSGGGEDDKEEVSPSSSADGEKESARELLSTHLFGILVHELVSGVYPFPEEQQIEGGKSHNNNSSSESSTKLRQSSGEPLLKKTMEDLLLDSLEEVGEEEAGENRSMDVDRSIKNKAFSRAVCISRNKDTTAAADDANKKDEMYNYVPLKDLGYPASLSLLVVNMLECGWGEFKPDDSCTSLKMAIADLRLLLEDPDRFLFDSLEKQGGRLNVKQDKLYGRDREIALITNFIQSVASSGESGALLVDGFSGCGKSKLIQSVIGQVDIKSMHVISGKFDAISQNSSQIGVLTNALNQLCILICEETNDRKDVGGIVTELKTVFGANLSTLARVIPKVSMLSEQLILSNGVDTKGVDQTTAINLSSVSYIVLLFLRVVSSQTRPVILYLDDLQWADSTTLDVIHCILSDIKGNNCVGFVGSYRSNEVEFDNHPMSVFKDKLEACQVQSTKIHLDGIEEAELNTLVSDALGIFPRMCLPLSNIIQRKTKGNPFYVLEFLKSLIDRNLLQFGLRERRWIWDDEKISSEQISESVSELLAQKISTLPEERQRALQIASCFGTSISSAVVNSLGEVEYHFLGRELECAYNEGFVEKSTPSGDLSFAHDRVREAVYNQIREEDRCRLHYSIGEALTRCGNLISDAKAFFICVDQMNLGHAAIINEPEKVLQVVEMNHSAASKALKACDFTAALGYSTTSFNLLGGQVEHLADKSILLVMANAAHACGNNEMASCAIEAILKDEASLDETTKLNTYELKIRMLVSMQEGKAAYSTTKDVLCNLLGENLPADGTFDPSDPRFQFQDRLDEVRRRLAEMTENDLMAMDELTSPTHLQLMRFYNHLAFISYFVRPDMLKWFTARLVELSLEHGVSKYSAAALVRFAMTLDTNEGYRIGKMGISLLQRFDAIDQLPSIFLSFYGYIAIYVEPLQSCLEMVKRGFEIGLSIRDATAFHNGNQYIHKGLLSGVNLQLLKNESDYQLRLINEHSQTTAKMYADLLNDSINCIKDTQHSGSGSEREDVSKNPEYEGSLIFHNAWQAFWLGYYDRCCYHCERGITLDDIKQIKSVMLLFLYGISSFHSSKSLKSNRKLKGAVKKAMKVMEERAKESRWNYANKLHLLEAESFSSGGHNTLAIKSYKAAIEASKSSRFIHEQGLACELAAIHCKKVKDLDTSLTYFQEAKACYEQWGSQPKVDAMIQQIDIIQKEGA